MAKNGCIWIVLSIVSIGLGVLFVVLFSHLLDAKPSLITVPVFLVLGGVIGFFFGLFRFTVGLATRKR